VTQSDIHSKVTISLKFSDQMEITALVMNISTPLLASASVHLSLNFNRTSNPNWFTNQRFSTRQLPSLLSSIL
jgi:hypothetical protein